MSVALQRKVQKVLDSRVRAEQPEVAEAIQGLSWLHAASAEQAARADGSLGVSGAPASLTLHRQFRSLLEARTVSLHRQLLDAFQPVRAELHALDACLAETATVATELATALQDIKARSNTLFHSAEALAAQKAEVAERAALVTTFLARFQLDPADAALLASTSEDAIGDAFFAALEAVERKKSDIENMLLGGTGGAPADTRSVVAGGSSRISLDLLDSLSKQLEASYELLYRSVSRQLQAGSVVKVSDLTPKFVRCFLLLRNVPVFFDHCLQDLLSSRRALLLERFLKALSRGSAGTRPIELSAHDSVRYTSDMMAWIHQALANEKEFLVALFPPEKDPPQQPNSALQRTSASQDGIDAPVHCFQRYLTSIFEALSRPLRVRIEQCFTSASGSSASASAANSASARVSPAASASSGASSVSAAASSATNTQVETVFKIFNILKFYSVIIQPILPPQAAATDPLTSVSQADSALASAEPPPLPPATDLLSTLDTLATQARATFFLLLAHSGRRLVTASPAPSADLQAGPEVSSWVAQVGAILAIYNSALCAPQEKEAEFAEFLGQLLDPLLRCLRVTPDDGAPSAAASPPAASAVSASSSSAHAVDADHLVYTLNVLHSLLTVCAPFASFVRTRMDQLQRLMQQQAARLVDVQAQAVLAQAGLARTLAAVTHWQNGPRAVPLARCDGMDMVTLTAGVNALYGSLLSAGAFIVPQCDRVTQSALRRECRVNIARAISQHYAQLFHAVHDPQSGFDPHAIGALFLHTPQHVDLLLDLQGAAAQTPMHTQGHATGFATPPTPTR